MTRNRYAEKAQLNWLTISILSGLLEGRAGSRGLHTGNIQVVTGMITDRLMERTSRYSISEEERDMIYYASALHDIGNMTVDSRILNKPDKLTASEYDLVRRHTAEGADILSQMVFGRESRFTEIAWQICRWHHERYDGSGYPDGLVGEEIPIAAQIVSLADAFDALTNDRVYQSAVSQDKAIEMILSGECGQFNPLLLECLQDLPNPLRSMELSELDFFFRDSHNMEKKLRLLEEKASRDALTGLLNQDAARDRIMATIAKHPERNYAMLFLDLDSFKSANDLYGHVFGNEILVFVADTLRQVVRDEDIVCRFGGDEFLIFAEYRQTIMPLVERIKKNLTVDYKWFPVRVSIGVTCLENAAGDYEGILHQADKAMYQAKQERDCSSHCVYPN